MVFGLYLFPEGLLYMHCLWCKQHHVASTSLCAHVCMQLRNSFVAVHVITLDLRMDVTKFNVCILTP